MHYGPDQRDEQRRLVKSKKFRQVRAKIIDYFGGAALRATADVRRRVRGRIKKIRRYGIVPRPPPTHAPLLTPSPTMHHAYDLSRVIFSKFLLSGMASPVVRLLVDRGFEFEDAIATATYTRYLPGFGVLHAGGDGEFDGRGAGGMIAGAGGTASEADDRGDGNEDHDDDEEEGDDEDEDGGGAHGRKRNAKASGPGGGAVALAPRVDAARERLIGKLVGLDCLLVAPSTRTRMPRNATLPANTSHYTTV